MPAHMRATNVATDLNYQAAMQENPYRWFVVDLEGDRAALEQRLIGDVASSKATDSKEQTILSKLEELEAKNGPYNKTKPEGSANPPAGVLDFGNKQSYRAWVLDSGGKEVVYTIEHAPGTKDEEFKVKGPWQKRS